MQPKRCNSHIRNSEESISTIFDSKKEPKPSAMIKELLIRKIKSCNNESLLLALFQIITNTEKHTNEASNTGAISDSEKSVGFAY